MPRSRSRSRRRRSRSRDNRDSRREDHPKEEPRKEESKKEGSSESDIVNVAIKQLPAKIRERLEKLFEEGLLKDNDLDLRSITVFASLNEGLQDRVMTHMENERIYVANARSKSGFLIATCDKAKTGCLDARGLGAIDPWRSALVAMATPKQKMYDLEPERDWIDRHGTEPVKLHVNIVCVEKEVGMPKVTVELPLTETSAALKSKLVSMGVQSVPTNKMKLHAEPVGFLKDRLPLAFYNLVDGSELELSVRARGGTKYRKDHAVPLKRPKTQDKQNTASNPLEFLKQSTGGGKALTLGGASAKDLLGSLGAPKAGGPLGGLPPLPGLPALPGLPGLPGLPPLGGAGAGATGPAAGPKLGGLPPLGGLGGLPSFGGPLGGPLGAPAGCLGGGGTIPGLGMTGPGGGFPPPGLGGGLPPLGGSMPGLGLPGLPGKVGGLSMPALGGMGLSKAGAMPMGSLPGGLDMPAMPKFGALDMPGMPKMGALDFPAMPKLGDFGGCMPKGGGGTMGATAKGGGMPVPAS